MSVLLRRARLTDAEAIAHVHSTSWQASYTGILPDSYLDNLGGPQLEARWRNRLGVPGECARIRVAEERGRLIGFSQFGNASGDRSLDGFAGEISMLYLDPDATGRGVGSTLLERSIEILEEMEYHWLVIWVVSRNERARSFYERHGLRADGATRYDRFDGDGVLVVRMDKLLNAAVDYDEIDRLLRSPRVPSRG